MSNILPKNEIKRIGLYSMVAAREMCDGNCGACSEDNRMFYGAGNDLEKTMQYKACPIALALNNRVNEIEGLGSIPEELIVRRLANKLNTDGTDGWKNSGFNPETIVEDLERLSLTLNAIGQYKKMQRHY